MKHPIPGVFPPDLEEVKVMIVWPTIGATRAGRLVGRLAGIRPPWDRLFLVGKLMAAATIPISLAVFVWQLLPFVCRRYRLTNRRISIQKGLRARDQQTIGLDEFDSIGILILPGQEWLRSGELIFQHDGKEVFRLSGVSRPEPLRAACLKARTALISVRSVLEQQQTAGGRQQPAASSQQERSP